MIKLFESVVVLEVERRFRPVKRFSRNQNILDWNEERDIPRNIVLHRERKSIFYTWIRNFRSLLTEGGVYVEKESENKAIDHA